MIKRIIIGFAFLACIGLISCSEKRINNVESSEEYVSLLKSLSEKQLEKQLKEDINRLENIIDSTETLEISYTMSFGMGSDGGSSPEIKEAEAFNVLNKNEVENDFFNAQRRIYVEQKLALPQSDFHFYSGRDQEDFQLIDYSDLDYKIEKVFCRNEELSPLDIPLKRIDSLGVLAKYRFPISFDTLVLNVGLKDSFKYDKQTIEIDTLGKQIAEFSVPVELAPKIIGNRGVTTDGILIANNSYSSFPSIVISPEVLGKMKFLKKRIQELQYAEDKEAIIKNLEKELDSSFYYKNQLTVFLSEFNSIANNQEVDLFEAVKELKKIQKKYAFLFSVSEMNYSIEFPNDVEKINLYVAQSYDSVSRPITVLAKLNKWDYYSFHDKEKNKHGIVDNNAEIIIPATYEKLYQDDNNYYTEYKDTTKQVYQLNVEDEILIPFKENISVNTVLNEDLVALENKDQYVGVFDNNRKEIIPFKYDNAILHEKVIIMTGSKRGRSFYHFYTLDGKQIQIPHKIVDYDFIGNAVVIQARNQLYGAINNEGEISLPIEYEIDNILSDSLCSFVDKEGESQSKKGIVNIETGVEVISPEDGYHLIYSYSDDGLAIVFWAKNGFEGRYGYINKNGEAVITPKFLDATDFYQGYAVVENTDEKMYLIDKKAKILKSFPNINATSKTYGNYAELIQLNDTMFFEINKRLYDYKGDPLGEELTNLIEN